MKYLKGYKLLIIFVAVLVIALAYGTFSFYTALSPASDIKGKTKVMEILPGMSTKAIAYRLEGEEVIRSATAFRLLAQYTGKEKMLQAGEYELDPGHSARQILKDLIEGKVKLRHITVPEGYTIKEIAKVLEEAKLTDAASFISAASDPGVLEAYGITASSAEGYLFPETYSFPREITAIEIVEKMLKTFTKKAEPLKRKYQPSSNLSFHEIVTLASIIEKETGDPREYRLVGAVYRNRLKRGMLLQADPTVIYGIKDFDGNLTRRHLVTDTPYNTYMRRGLPPGPIANPGLKAIEAAYHPEDVDYLYFVAKKAGGEHKFSRTLQEHNRAVRRYQLGRR